jgi:hypothetical protein
LSVVRPAFRDASTGRAYSGTPVDVPAAAEPWLTQDH